MRDKGDPETMPFFEGVDQSVGGAGKAVVAPTQDHIQLPLAGRFSQQLVWWSVLPCAAGLGDVLPHNLKTPPFRVFPQGHPLRRRGLPCVERGHPGLDCHARLRYHSQPIREEGLCDGLLCHTQGLDF